MPGPDSPLKRTTGKRRRRCCRWRRWRTEDISMRPPSTSLRRPRRLHLRWMRHHHHLLFVRPVELVSPSGAAWTHWAHHGLGRQEVGVGVRHPRSRSRPRAVEIGVERLLRWWWRSVLIAGFELVPPIAVVALVVQQCLLGIWYSIKKKY